jgi:hypothetical protein
MSVPTATNDSMEKCPAELWPAFEDSSRLVREKTRAHLLQFRAFATLGASSWESEELDERPHALFLTAARKSLGSC